MKIDAEWLNSEASQTVCGMLTDGGFDAYFVGGCVRNALLGVSVNDLDISTDARPEKVMELATKAGLKTVPTGIEHGTVTVIAGDTPFEITTYRRDVETDGRRAVVAFADNITDDARRRDFTMNALYAGPDGLVVDPLGGLPDLQARRVRFIEDADRRIQEDYLRILRFFRFTAWYADAGEGIDADGLAACAAHVDGIDGLSAERIGQEMLKLLSAPNSAPAVAAMHHAGVLLRVLPGADPAMLPVLEHIEDAAGWPAGPLRRLACLGGDRTRLRLSKAQDATIGVLQSDLSPSATAYHHGAEVGRSKLALEAAIAHQPITQAQLADIEVAANAVFPLKAADLMPDLQGKALGDALKAAEARWIASGFTLTKDDLLA